MAPTVPDDDPVHRTFVATFDDGSQVHVLEWSDGVWEASRRDNPNRIWSAPVKLEEEGL